MVAKKEQSLVFNINEIILSHLPLQRPCPGYESCHSLRLPFLPEPREIASGTLLGITNINRRFATADVKRTDPSQSPRVHISEIQFINPIIYTHRDADIIEFRIMIKRI